MAERFAFIHVGKVNFDKWDAHREQCVTYCDAGMGKSGRVDQNKVDCLIACGVNAFDQFMFGIALQAQQMMATLAGKLAQMLIDLLQRCRAIDTGLAAAKAIKVGSMQDQYASHFIYLYSVAESV